MSDSSPLQGNNALTPQSRKVGLPSQLQTTLGSPEEAWEDWMEWDPPSLNQHTVFASHNRVEDPLENTNSFLPAHTSSQGLRQPGPLSKKRKASEDLDGTVFRSQGESHKGISVPYRSHNLVEKRYRANLNDKIAELRQSIPSLRDDAQDSAPSLKLNKATVLTKATEYIHQLEKRNAYLEDANAILRKRTVSIVENDSLQSRKEDNIERKEVTPKSWSSVCSISPVMSQGSTSATDEPRGMIPVPEDFKRLRDSVPPQPHYADQFSHGEREETVFPGTIAVRGGKIASKLLVGSLAGLMLMDGFAGSREEGSSDRGLFAVPMPFSAPLLRMNSLRVQTLLLNMPSNYMLVLLIRGFLVFSMLGIALFLYLFNSKPKLGKFNVPTGDMTSVTSSLPIEMRRNAWLTAIQTVWVPRHTMLPELWALIRETHAYLTRKVFGWYSYSWLTGRNGEDEVSRVRAWEIAIDAQLAGGDAEMSRSRLVLTLWASGTLPNTPARLMLKALHIRILFWQASRYKLICEALTAFARYLAYKQWKIGEDVINNPTVSKGSNGQDPLPDHLVALLQQPVDVVMTDSTIQQAYNLAWNGTLPRGEGIAMDLEDTAILGSLDFLGAYFSTSKLHCCLYAFIGAINTEEPYLSQLELALRVAPPGSVSYLKALAVATVICESDRVTNIARLSLALQPSDNFPLHASVSATASVPNLVGQSLSVALDCAIAMETLANSEQDHAPLCKALDVAGRALSNNPSLDLLAFAAAYQLLLSLSRHCALTGQIAASFNEVVMKAASQMDEPSASATAARSRLHENYQSALRGLILPGAWKRRVSVASFDTGYGSMSDDDRRRS